MEFMFTPRLSKRFVQFHLPDVVNWYTFPFIVPITRSYPSVPLRARTMNSDEGACTARTCAYTSSLRSIERMHPVTALTMSTVPLLATTMCFSRPA